MMHQCPFCKTWHGDCPSRLDRIATLFKQWTSKLIKYDRTIFIDLDLLWADAERIEDFIDKKRGRGNE